MGQKLTVSAREASPMDDAGFFSVELSYKMALVSSNITLAVLRCSAPDQALAVRCLERCACRSVTLLRLSPPVAAGAVPCTTRDMVIISCSSSALRSPIAVSAFEVRSIEVRLFAEDIQPTLTCPQEEPCYLLFFFFPGTLRTNRLVLETLECSRVRIFCKNLKAEANSCKAGKCGTSR